MHTLPPPPAGLRSLTDPEVARLRKQDSNLWADPKKTCLTCSKTGTFKERVGSEIVEVACDCLAQWKMHRWMLNAGIGLRYQRFSWTDAVGVPDGVKRTVVDYMTNAEVKLASGNGLTLWSPDRGTGKTLLAALMAKGLLAAGHDVYFTQFNEMLDFFSDGWRDKDEREWFIRKVRNAQVLVTDDMGREHKGRSEVAEAMFDSVIRARDSSARPTIITTNYTPAQMQQGYGGNISSLLSGVNNDVEVSGVDFRPTAKERLLRDQADGITTYPIVVG